MPTRSTGSPGVLVVVFAAFGLACASSGPAPGTAPPTDAPPEPQTFTAQVALGQDLYAQSCASCHGAAGEGGRAPRLVGFAEGALPLDPPADSKARTGRFETVADVGTFVVENMPPGGAGKLTTEQYLAILAFDLKANGIDLGDDKLTMEKAAELTIPR